MSRFKCITFFASRSSNFPFKIVVQYIQPGEKKATRPDNLKMTEFGSKPSLDLLSPESLQKDFLIDSGIQCCNS